MTQTDVAGTQSPRVDFGYAFATPHRLTVALPDSGDKTLLDAQPGMLRMAWTYDDLRDKPLAAYTPPRTGWEVLIKPELDGQPLPTCQWRRVDGWLPVLENTYQSGRVRVRMEVVGGTTAAMVRIDLENLDASAHRLAVRCEKPGGWAGYNPAWIDRNDDADVLLAGWTERADRIVVFAIGGDERPAVAPSTLSLVWNLDPGGRRTAWLIRPYQAHQSLLPVLRSQDWSREFAAAKQAWHTLLARSTQISLPDPLVNDAFRAAVADCFIMREPVAQGYVAACPGTEQYRAPNSFEPAIVAVLLDQVGLHTEAALGYQMCLEQQGPDGNWNDPQGWGHHMWGGSGFKSWAALEHYRLTGDHAYLAGIYPRLLASSRWQETQRAKTRVAVDGSRPLTYGLLPRGMGDCGLKGEDGSHYGVFLPHNIWAVQADAWALETARILGRSEDLAELEAIHRRGREDLLAALERGAISEDGYRWIPGVPGQTCGSRWGALNAAFPCAILSPDHELISGTIRKIETRLSPGGIPIHTGWMENGMWVAITLDNLAEVLLCRDQGDAAIRYFYATLNHGTPLFSWCEERGPEPGAKDCSGDRQHLWTPVAVGRFLRDAVVMEQDGALHLARGTARHWLEQGLEIRVEQAPTHFGAVSYTIVSDADRGSIRATVDLPVRQPSRETVLHLRHPRSAPMASVTVDGRAWTDFDPAREVVNLGGLCGTLRVEVVYRPGGR